MNAAERQRKWRKEHPDEYREYLRNWHKNNPKKSEEYRRNYVESSKYHDARLRRNYGITLEQYNGMLAKQGGCCAICRGPQTGRGKLFRIDHNHMTGKVRGLLCQHCNLLIGQARENPEVLSLAIKYLTGADQ